MYDNRIDAGKKIAQVLQSYQDDKNAIVIGLPRGGVVVAAIVARELNLQIDVTCPRKIGFPSHEEFAIGAITETGQSILNEEVIHRYQISKSYIEKIKEKERQKAQYRLEIYRKGLPARNLKNKTVILIDDGLATGATMKAAIQTVKTEGASRIIVVVPVAPFDTVEEIRELVDEIIVLEIPHSFEAVGQFYREFTQVEDEEVVSILTDFHKRS